MLFNSQQFTTQGLSEQEIMSLYLVVLDIFFHPWIFKAGFFFDESVFLGSAVFCEKELCILTEQCVKIFLFPPASFMGCPLVFQLEELLSNCSLFLYFITFHTEVHSLSLIMLLVLLCPSYISAINWNRKICLGFFYLFQDIWNLGPSSEKNCFVAVFYISQTQFPCKRSMAVWIWNHPSIFLK